MALVPSSELQVNDAVISDLLNVFELRETQMLAQLGREVGWHFVHFTVVLGGVQSCPTLDQ